MLGLSSFHALCRAVPGMPRTPWFMRAMSTALHGNARSTLAAEQAGTLHVSDDAHVLVLFMEGNSLRRGLVTKRVFTEINSPPSFFFSFTRLVALFDRNRTLHTYTERHQW